MKRLPLALILALLIPVPAAHAAPQRACTRILILDEYGRDVSPCARAHLMSAGEIIELVRARLALG